MVKFNVLLDDALHYDFKVFCVQNQLKMTDVVRQLIEEYLEKAAKRQLKRR